MEDHRMISKKELMEMIDKASDNAINYLDGTEVISLNSLEIILNEFFKNYMN